MIYILCAVFLIVLFLYIHIFFHLKTSDDLDIYDIETPSKDKLEEMFGRYGLLTKFIMSPSNTLAIAEFSDSQHAVNCIKKLAYFEIDSVPLYLEFAPEGLIEKNVEKSEKKDEFENYNKITEINLVGNEGKILFIMKFEDFSQE